MWEVRNQTGYDEEYEMLTAQSSGSHRRGHDDTDKKAINTVNYKTESYQSTARILVWALCVLTGLMLIITCATVGSSIASTRKSLFGITGIMPSINLTDGDCDSLKYPNLILHLLINCIGTIIIAASNYLQQSTLCKT
jgi:hypothetical protein